MTFDELVVSIDSLVESHTQEISVLEAARAALVATDRTSRPSRPIEVAATPVATRSTNGAKPHKARQRRARRDPVPAAKIERLLIDGGELTTGQLAERAGGDRDQILGVLRELETAGKVSRSGERRTTKWRAFTDEDWVSRRAAELASAGPDPLAHL